MRLKYGVDVMGITDNESIGESIYPYVPYTDYLAKGIVLGAQQSIGHTLTMWSQQHSLIKCSYLDP